MCENLNESSSDGAAERSEEEESGDTCPRGEEGPDEGGRGASCEEPSKKSSEEGEGEGAAREAPDMPSGSGERENQRLFPVPVNLDVIWMDRLECGRKKINERNINI